MTKINILGDTLGIPIEQNLIFKAAELFLKSRRLTAHITIAVKKNIPTGAGLGGGSSNAAIVLRELHKHFGGPSVAPLAAKLGADCRFFLEEGPAWCTGRGEKCRPEKTQGFFAVLVLFKKGVSTPWAYRLWDEVKPSSNFGHKLPKGDGDIPFFENDFEKVILPVRPDLKRAQIAIAQAGALSARMSGSGATFFGVYKERALAAKATHKLRKQGYRCVLAEIRATK